jgi:NAD(P)-dependent dehydrogenase (short-subunit alcohol dehydrogenase family)
MTLGFATPFKSLVIGSTGAIGAAFVSALHDDPLCERVVELNRTLDPSFDLRGEQGVENALSKPDLAGPFDLIVDATGALTFGSTGPEKSLQALCAAALNQSLWINCIGPALLLKGLVPRLSSGRCIYAKLSARVGSITDNKLGGWYSYRASKAAFNQILHTAAIEHHRRNKKAVFVALQPGTVASPLSSPFVQASKAMGAKESVEGLLRAIGPLESMSGAHFIDFNGQSIPW